MKDNNSFYNEMDVLFFILLFYGFGLDINLSKDLEEKIKQYIEEHKENFEQLSKGVEK